MANISRLTLESALRAKRLDSTVMPVWAPELPADAAVPSTLPALETVLRGGFPRGQLSELVGPRSSGRTTALLSLLAAMTQRGEIAALVDTLDQLDVVSAAAAQVDLSRLLWIRGDQVSALHGPLLERVIDRALKALNLVLQSGGFGLVVIDLADIPRPALARLPMTTWLRVQRVLEGRDTAGVIVATEPVARSARGVTVQLEALPSRVQWSGASARSRLLSGLALTGHVRSPHRHLVGTFAADMVTVHDAAVRRVVRR